MGQYPGDVATIRREDEDPGLTGLIREWWGRGVERQWKHL